MLSQQVRADLGQGPDDRVIHGLTMPQEAPQTGLLSKG